MTPDEATPSEASAAPPAPAPTPKKADTRKKGRSGGPSAPPTPAKEPEAKDEGPKAAKRPTLEPELTRLLTVRRATDRRRPLFVAQAAHRYWRIGRKESWRRPRGLQSKQRRRYGYRSESVSIGYGSPRRTRGLTPTGYRPVLVRTFKDLEALDRLVDAAIIARTVGTRRRLVLEETARKLGVHVLNPINAPGREE
jgi:large subunit ribosomal protein L32e